MAVKIRLQRHGAKKAPFYRLVVADSRAKRDGRFVELIGTYNPKSKRPEEQLRVQLDRANYWLRSGAQPSDTARSLINRARRLGPQSVEPETAEKAPLPTDVLIEARSQAETTASTAASAAPASEPARADEEAHDDADDVIPEDTDLLTAAMDLGEEESIEDAIKRENEGDDRPEQA